MPTSALPVTGLLLAAGAGRRMGMPKALVETDGVPWVRRSVDVLLAGGCARVTVVVGAAEDRVRRLLAEDRDLAVVACPTWAKGMGESLRAGLLAVAERDDGEAALVHLVDLPDVGGDVVGRVLAAGTGAAALTRAAYAGVPGHPVVLGRDHWAGVAAVATGDQGAREYLRRHRPALVECGDLAGGADVDTPARR